MSGQEVRVRHGPSSFGPLLGLALLLPSGIADTAAVRSRVEWPLDVDASRPPVYDQELGLPRLVWGRGGGPSERGPEGPAAKAVDVERRARALVERLAPMYALDARALATLRAVEVRTGADRVVRFEQRIDGVAVLDRELTLRLDASDQLILASGNLSPHAPSGTARVVAAQAVESAWRSVTGSRAVPRSHVHAMAPEWQTLDLETADGWRAVRPARVRAAWYDDGSSLRPAWQVELVVRDGAGSERAESLVVDADDGNVLTRRTLLAEASYEYLVWADARSPGTPQDGPQGDTLLPHPTGAPDGPLPVPQQRTQRKVDATVYRPGAPWFRERRQDSMQGEQVAAFVDADGGDLCIGCTTSRDLVAEPIGDAFAYPWDPGAEADASEAQMLASLVQAFYTVNHLADWFHAGGFDEAAGNHQRDNRGRGGIGGDPLDLQTLDADIPNNANAMVPADGSPPRIQLGAFQRDLLVMITFTGGHTATLPQQAVGGAMFGPQDFDQSAEVVAATDGEDAAFDLCSTPTGSPSLAGRIALVERGTCLFVDKVRRAQAAGAAGVIIHNNIPTGSPNGGIIYMSGVAADVTIPALFISQEEGATLRAALGGATAVTARMQRDSGLGTDSALDSSVVAHEWGHVLTGRMVRTDFPAMVPCNVGSCPPMGPQPQGLDEGFADFVALLYLVGPETGPTAYQGTYAIGAWVTGYDWEPGAYYGWRRYPYTTDMTRNPLTFGHIAADAVLPADIPNNASGSPMTEVHNVGEVWAVTLWEAYASLLRSGRASHAATRDRMRDYLVATLRLLPDNPTFIDARNVMLTVVGARSSADHALFAAAFAKRGLGRDALGPLVSDMDNARIEESFVVAPSPQDGRDRGGGGGAPTALLLIALAALTVRRALRR